MGQLLGYTVVGKSGNTLIFIHGAGSNSSIWKPYLSSLKNFRSLLIDLPGHGISQSIQYQSIEESARQIVEVLKKEKISRAVLVGQSLGALIASEIAVISPIVVAKVVMVSPFESKTVFGGKFIGFLARLFRCVSGAPRGEKPLQEYGPLFDSPLLIHPITDLKGTHVKTYAKTVEDVMNYKVDWDSLKVPCLVVFGSRDVFFSRKAIEEQTKKNKKIKRVEIDMHHLLVTHAKDDLIKALRDFI